VPPRPHVVVDQVRELDGGRRIAERVGRDLVRRGQQCRAHETRDRADQAEGGDAARGDGVRGAEQAIEPDGGEGLGDDQQQFHGDDAAG
jgi:hypothetical protein